MANSKAIALPFAFNETGGVYYTVDDKKAWQDRVVAAVMTNLGERVMRPTYGSDVNAALFENIGDALVILKQSVQVVFQRWLPQLTLMDVKGNIDPIDGHLLLEITYKLTKEQNEQRVSIKTAILTRAGDILLEVTNG